MFWLRVKLISQMRMRFLLKAFRTLGVEAFVFRLSFLVLLGRALRERITLKSRVLIAGPPNTGKSSLFNSLLSNDRSIVSSVAGTTRDLIDSELVLQNVVLTLGDSAGVRDTEDLVESAGINISFDEIKKSRLVILVFDEEQKTLFLYSKSL